MNISVSKSRLFFLFFGFVVLFVLFNPTSSAFAANDEDWDVKLTAVTPYSIEQEDGFILFFDNESDYNSYLEAQNIVQPLCATCNQTTQTLVSSETKRSQFINYHPVTTFWSPAEYYLLTVSDSFCVTGSLKWTSCKEKTSHNYVIPFTTIKTEITSIVATPLIHSLYLPHHKDLHRKYNPLYLMIHP